MENKSGNYPVIVGAIFCFICLSGCSRSQPVADQAVLAAEQTERGLVGYQVVDYEYPVLVPGTNRYVTMKTKAPLDNPPTYDDYLAWQATQ